VFTTKLHAVIKKRVRILLYEGLDGNRCTVATSAQQSQTGFTTQFETIPWLMQIQTSS